MCSTVSVMLFNTWWAQKAAHSPTSLMKMTSMWPPLHRTFTSNRYNVPNWDTRTCTTRGVWKGLSVGLVYYRYFSRSRPTDMLFVLATIRSAKLGNINVLSCGLAAVTRSTMARHRMRPCYYAMRSTQRVRGMLYHAKSRNTDRLLSIQNPVSESVNTQLPK